MEKIAVAFPGIGYNCDRPLLYHSMKLAKQAGFGTLKRTGFSPVGKEGLKGNDSALRELVSALLLQAEEQLRDVDWGDFGEILFLSKSIGTGVAAAYAKKNGLTDVRHVLYTPLELTYDFELQNALAFIGTADPWSDSREIVRLSKEAGIPVEVYEDCNHSLETGDVIRDTGIIRDIMARTEDWLSGN